MKEYKGYIGRVEFDDEADIFHGEVINTRDVITFQGSSVRELRKAFRQSIDEYLSFCHERGEEPDKPYSGQFVARVGPDLHRKISHTAAIEGKSLNTWVAEQLDTGVSSSTRSNLPMRSEGIVAAELGKKHAETLNETLSDISKILLQRNRRPSKKGNGKMRSIAEELTRLASKGVVRSATSQELAELVRRHVRESESNIQDLVGQTFVLDGGTTVWKNVEDEDGHFYLGSMDERFYIIAIRDEDDRIAFSLQTPGNGPANYSFNSSLASLEDCMKRAEQYETEILTSRN